MKHTQICPKCDSSNVLKIKGGSTWTGYQNFIMGSMTKIIPVTRYLCGNCGFSEEWIENPKGLEILNKKHGGDNSGSQFV